MKLSIIEWIWEMWFCDEVWRSWEEVFENKVYMLCFILIQYVIVIDWALVDIRILRIFALNFIKWEWKFGDVLVNLCVIVCDVVLMYFPLDYLI